MIFMTLTASPAIGKDNLFKWFSISTTDMLGSVKEKAGVRTHEGYRLEFLFSIIDSRGKPTMIK